MMTNSVFPNERLDGSGGGRITLPVDFPEPVRWSVPIRAGNFPSLSQGAWFIDADHLLTGRGHINDRGNITIGHLA
jgi:hypothetical protein